MRMQGKVVIITGGAGGVGQAFARGFLKEGAKVCIGDVNEENGGTVVDQLGKDFGSKNVIFSKCDVTSDQSFEQTFENCKSKLGEVDILINNAGIINEKDFEATLKVNLGGTIRGCELAIKKIGKQNGGKGGHVVNVASAGGIFPFIIVPFYAASKGGAVHYSRSVGHEFHTNYNGVVVQCFCPTFVATPLLAITDVKKYNEMTAKAYEAFIEKFKMLQPEDLVEPMFKLIEEGRRGGVMVVEGETNAYYVEALTPLGPH